MKDFAFKRQQKAERFHELAEKHETFLAGGTLRRGNVEENRLQIFFPEIPEESVRRESARIRYSTATTLR